MSWGGSPIEANGNIVWFATVSDTTPLNSTDLLSNGSDYWAAESDTALGCISSVRVVVSVTLTDPGTPILSSQGGEFCIIENPTVGDLDLNVSAASNGIVNWYDSYPNGSTLSLNEFLIDGETYYALETDDQNCTSVNPLTVTVDLYACDDYDIVIYDGFSPEGDGINDTFTIENLRILYPDFSVEFFNRWGNSIYVSNAQSPDWNGRLHGDQELAPVGVYYFVINFNKDNRKPIQQRLYLSR